MTKFPMRFALPALTLLLGACGGSGSDTVQGAGSSKDGAVPSSTSNLPTPATEADRYMVEYVEAMDGITAALKGVHDEASAKAAGEKIQSWANELKSKFDAAGSMSDAEIGAAGARYASALQKAQSDFSQAMMPLAMNPQYAKYVSDAMKELPKAPKGK